ncbi:CinA family protein [Anatilimnocola floriformis]|uniref:CinA family protein n=1 Tax=Anatilimnocola floriformis TaxID=2948575 RepID=UPI0020C4343A|nr:CinA family protein [Anatilimnocola floriformis]
MDTSEINAQARRVAQLLATRQKKVATAESCTGGLVAGALTAVAGISARLCGGVIVYRNETKHALLDISQQLLADPGPVSEIVAQQMAQRVLTKIPEADVSIAITGHLGPNAPADLDGVVWLAVGARKGEESAEVWTKKLHLPPLARIERQQMAVAGALDFLASNLEVSGR